MENQSPPKQKKQGSESSKLPENYPLLGYLASGEEVWDREDEPIPVSISAYDAFCFFSGRRIRVKELVRGQNDYGYDRFMGAA